ncbi:MAG: hypothetical protein KDN20_16170 [Verrucomicrobiae bacterium]|nr:hypothetical protein [Verrucomicrobiae bacterium]
MTIKFEYDASMDCIVIETEGVIVYDDLAALMQGLMSHEKFRPNISQILDCTNAALEIPMNQIKRFAAEASKLGEVFGEDRKLAMVVSRDIDFAQMRQYEAFLQIGPGVQVQIFRSLDQARGWIRG